MALVQAFTNAELLQTNNLDSENALSLYLPNSYEFYWNTSAEKIANKLAKDYRNFWTEERKSEGKEKRRKKRRID